MATIKGLLSGEALAAFEAAEAEATAATQDLLKTRLNGLQNHCYSMARTTAIEATDRCFRKE